MYKMCNFIRIVASHKSSSEDTASIGPWKNSCSYLHATSKASMRHVPSILLRYLGQAENAMGVVQSLALKPMFRRNMDNDE